MVSKVENFKLKSPKNIEGIEVNYGSQERDQRTCIPYVNIVDKVTRADD